MTSVVVPHIETPRLLLRAYRASDFDAYAAHLADPDANRFTTCTDDRRAAWRMFAAGAGTWVLERGGWWAIEERERKAVVGVVGAFYREAQEELEIGWSLYRASWGNGYATEAALGAVAHAFESRGAPCVIAHVDPRNTASIRVTERLGMRYERDVDLFDTATGRYVLDRP